MVCSNNIIAEGSYHFSLHQKKSNTNPLKKENRKLSKTFLIISVKIAHKSFYSYSI